MDNLRSDAADLAEEIEVGVGQAGALLIMDVIREAGFSKSEVVMLAQALSLELDDLGATMQESKMKEDWKSGPDSRDVNEAYLFDKVETIAGKNELMGSGNGPEFLSETELGDVKYSTWYDDSADQLYAIAENQRDGGDVSLMFDEDTFDEVEAAFLEYGGNLKALFDSEDYAEFGLDSSYHSW